MAYIEGQQHCTDWLGEIGLSADQRTCIEVLCAGLGSAIYKVPTNWKKMERIGTKGLKLSLNKGGLSTFDFDELTGLVIHAHKELVRVSIIPSGPRMLGVTLFKRQADGRMNERHPGIADLVERATSS
jgi:hypothetical protein